MKQIELPPIAEGETYIGCTGDKDGNLTHIILLPGDNDGADWNAQIEWAKSIGGDLPTRVEQAMLWQSHKDLFQNDWYWSNEQHASDSDYAWIQGFYHGYQGDSLTYDECRARAVRRLPI